MNVTSVSSSASAPVESAADKATDAALAKATAKLAADRKSGASASVLRDDQRLLSQTTKAAQKADDDGKTASSTKALSTTKSALNVTA